MVKIVKGVLLWETTWKGGPLLGHEGDSCESCRHMRNDLRARGDNEEGLMRKELGRKRKD